MVSAMSVVKAFSARRKQAQWASLPEQPAASSRAPHQLDDHDRREQPSGTRQSLCLGLRLALRGCCHAPGRVAQGRQPGLEVSTQEQPRESGLGILEARLIGCRNNLPHGPVEPGEIDLKRADGERPAGAGSSCAAAGGTCSASTTRSSRNLPGSKTSAILSTSWPSCQTAPLRQTREHRRTAGTGLRRPIDPGGHFRAGSRQAESR